MARSHVLYWIWLSLCVPPGSKAADTLLSHFEENAERIYTARAEEFDRLELSEEIKAKLLIKDPTEAKSIYFWCKEHDVRILPYDSPDFPDRLRRIGRKPILLYCKGRTLDLNDNLMIAMVGTRRMSSYGKRTAYVIAHDATLAGAMVVSGMALGIDAVCHRGALDAKGMTVAVLGCGIDIAYPKENLDLMMELEKDGLVISEFKPGTRPGRSTFPIRNRIISGLCQGTFVVEGDKNSGAMITAKSALSQGRDLFALPGMVGEQNSEGTNALLREGAIPVTCAADLLSDYSILYPAKVFVERIPIYRPEIILTPVTKEKQSRKPEGKRASPIEEPLRAPLSVRASDDTNPFSAPAPSERSSEPERPEPPGLSENGKILFRIFAETQAPLTADQITAKCELAIGQVMTALTILEIKGIVLALPGGRFILK